MMKLLALVPMLLLIVACGSSTPPVAPSTGAPAPGVAPVVTTEGGTVAESPQVRTAPAASYTEKLQQLLDKTQKVKSYSFYYVDSTTQLQTDQWYVKGDKAMVRLYEPNYWNSDEWVDTVYLDMAVRTATGYCENWQQVRCTDNNRKFNIVFGTFDKKLPTYWITQIPTTAQVVGSETIDERFVTKVQWAEGGKTSTVWMDNTFGLPVKILIEGAGEQMFYYKDMAFNAVKDEVLGHQFVKRG